MKKSAKNSPLNGGLPAVRKGSMRESDREASREKQTGKTTDDADFDRARPEAEMVVGAVGNGSAASIAGRFRPAISKEETADLPPIAFGGGIVVIDTVAGLEKACQYLGNQQIIGFDTESRASFQKGVVNRISLLQLSTDERTYLIRLCKVRLEKPLLKILETNRITKVGLSIDGDIRELGTLKKLRPRGFVDLQKIVPQYGITDLSLLKIAAIVLGRRISKAQRLSNWEAAQLTEAQQLYAATDAWVCTEIYKRLTEQR